MPEPRAAARSPQGEHGEHGEDATLPNASTAARFTRDEQTGDSFALDMVGRLVEPGSGVPWNGLRGTGSVERVTAARARARVGELREKAPKTAADRAPGPDRDTPVRLMISTAGRGTPSAMSRPTLDRARRLDLRSVLRFLRRQPPDSLIFPTVRWSDGSTIGVTLTERKLILDYQADGRPIREELRLDRTPCTYGGSRTWVLCPNCGARRAVLYAAPASYGRFLCRGCYGWPYGSQGERAHDRALRRARTIRAQQGDDHPDAFAPLLKKPYQRWSTFERVTAEHHAALVSFLDGMRKRLSGYE